MNIYNETANMDGSKVFEQFKKATSMESALICFIKANGKSSVGGSADISYITHRK